jgi:Flp pilus assembly protein CpaB
MKRKSNTLVAIGALAFLIGAGLVVGALRGGDDAVAADHLESTVLVARDTIPPGTAGDDLVARGLVVAREVASDSRAGDALTSTAELAGRILDVEIQPGEQLLASQLRPQSMRAAAIEIPVGKQGVALQLPFVAGGAGYVAAGDRVNIYGNLPEEDGAVTKLVLANVEVLDVSSEVAPRVAGDEVRPTGGAVTYLLALDPHEAERVIYLAANAEVWFALTGAADAPVPMTSGRRAADILS